MKSDIFDIQVKIHHDSPQTKAILVSLDGDEKKAVWLPRSMIEYEYTNNRTGAAEISAPEWFLLDKGLI